MQKDPKKKKKEKRKKKKEKEVKQNGLNIYWKRV